MPTLQTRYNDVLSREGWSADPEQRAAVNALQRLREDLSIKKTFWPFRKKTITRGVYLYGGVGRGKSMLMDLFYEALPIILKKRRVHFHEFMIETHDWLHIHRGDNMADLLPAYARHVAKNTRILCFDEFHVTDVADAMILGRLFTALFERGVVVVSTSNWAPDNLYEGGLQRELFLPFIALLKQHMEIIHLDSDTDYRTLSDPCQDVYYFSPLNDDIKKKIQILFDEMSEGHDLLTKKLEVKGRTLEVQTAHDIARFTFEGLCEQPLGAEDYIKVAQSFDTIFLENIPTLTPERRNEAKRLILLIDCLYEAHCRLVISAENDIHNLHQGGDHAFEFDRTISRLMEMQSCGYHEKRVALRGASS